MGFVHGNVCYPLKFISNPFHSHIRGIQCPLIHSKLTFILSALALFFFHKSSIPICILRISLSLPVTLWAKHTPKRVFGPSLMGWVTPWDKNASFHWVGLVLNPVPLALPHAPHILSSIVGKNGHPKSFFIANCLNWGSSNKPSAPKNYPTPHPNILSSTVCRNEYPKNRSTFFSFPSAWLLFPIFYPNPLVTWPHNPWWSTSPQRPN
mgnify:CR=1 FL=1